MRVDEQKGKVLGNMTVNHVKRLGILGGSFDPIHNGHLLIGQEAVSFLNLDLVLFVPTPQNPLKDNAQAADFHRENMLHKAVDKHGANFKVHGLEIDRAEQAAKQGQDPKIYTIDTLKAYREFFGPDVTLYLIVGADTIMNMHNWREIESFKDYCTLAVFDRFGYPSMQFGLPRQIARYDIPWEFIPVFPPGFSSTEIRARLKTNQPLRFWLPFEVLYYINEQRLYGATYRDNLI